MNNTLEIPSDIALLNGPILLGFFFNWALVGALTIQVFLYHIHYPNDSKKIKYLVYGLYLTEWVQTILMTNDAFQWFVFGYGHPNTLDNYYTSWFNVPVLTGIISMVVQLFFSWRVWILARKYLIPCTIAFIALTQGCAGVASGIQLRELPNFLALSTLSPAVSVWHAGSATADILIAVSMTYLLLKRKSTHDGTNYVVLRLIQLTVETGSITAVASILDLVLFLVFPNTNLHMCAAIMLGKLYTNSLVVGLNNRFYAQRHHDRRDTTSTRVQFEQNGNLSSLSSSSNANTTNSMSSDAYKLAVLPDVDTGASSSMLKSIALDSEELCPLP
ncbi:hypothetical protein SERLA73DRAFT_187806 [Serpula lacrymans var. lacrymans S7.3]|uniref:DUF6534 domain-containing protein n=2 Tax=Serpula lacrymans var. lacrymans TaxID=341189 RepID=F8QAF9_SERL3|nr:uncharacterized protein SERLADRAFT_477612 [Serpula lacrymans var. lacrymans S7.9]EGN94749.1 hypothetical protein SERLA73DRAFT_187806 [Serpula lacrymans var. lacrymans S7.3]EGO20226.1 hypothetical protein SERLADRAFT_477612 [Serpula lacrymans var. lacrymans S7.9]